MLSNEFQIGNRMRAFHLLHLHKINRELSQFADIEQVHHCWLLHIVVVGLRKSQALLERDLHSEKLKILEIG
jgi:hypothetical protein